jgi:peptide-methionine (S)-S-oxide reductase
VKPAGKGTAIFAMGCFWQPDEFFRTVPGVLATEVGYTGGRVQRPSYEQVCDHSTGHAEAVKVTFDPSVVSYGELLNLFWNNHDPTTLNRQGPDHGDQYRSAVFCVDEEQRAEATASRDKVEKEQLWGGDPIVTAIVPEADWWPAEDYHQKYLMKHGVTRCHLPTPPKGRR